MTDREAFEQWAGDGFAGTLGRDLEGEYRNHFIQWQWEGWQAALAYRSEQASQGQVPEDFKLVPVTPTTEMIHAGMRPGVGFYETGEVTEEMAEACYQAMVDAAPLPHKEGG